MKTLRSSAIVLCLMALGLAFAAESTWGGFLKLAAANQFDQVGGGNCYSSIADDDTCANYAAPSCAANACERRVRMPSGAVYYFCLQAHIKVKEYAGWRSKVNSGLTSGKSQPLTLTFYCSQKQNCFHGENCTEVTEAGTVTWKCVADGGFVLVDQVTDHYAGGTNCPGSG